MEKRNTLLQLSFIIVIFLTLGLAFMHVSENVPASSEPSGKSAEIPAREEPSLLDQRRMNALKEEELMDVLPPVSLSASAAAKNDKRARLVRRYLSRPNLSIGPSSVSAGASSVSSPHGPYGLSQGGGISFGGTGSGAYAYSPVAGENSSFRGSAAGQGRGNSAGGVPSRVGGTSGFAGVARPSAEEKRDAIFAPYLTSLTPEAAKSLERQLTGLSSRVERAVLQAMLPKSRKDANIEKYLQRNSSHNASAGPFAGVMEQISAQKAGIMNSMNGAFGKDAADEAGKVMDAYQKELATALSQPGLTQEQAAQKTRAIGAKYEKELQKVGQKHALKDFEAKQMEKDNFLQEGLASAYGADFAAQAGDILASWREKDMQLALSGLPAEEYYKQQFENQRARRKELDKLCQQYGYSPDAFRKVENEWENKRVNQVLKDEREGKTLPTKHHFDESYISSTATDLGKEHNEKEQTARNLYGEEGAKAVNDIYNRYEARMSKILNSDKPLSDKLDEMKNARQEANAEIAALQKTPEMMKARVDTTMEQLMQDPGLANATPEQREAFERRARPVLQDMFQRINEVSESNLPEDEKKRRIAALQDRAQRQLSGQ